MEEAVDNGRLVVLRYLHSEQPLPRDRVAVLGRETPFPPNVPSAFTELRAPGAIRVRPGVQGIDFEGPDGFVVPGLPNGAVCAFDLDSL